MNILILSHSYTPAINPRAFRWTAISEYLVSQGHDVAVVCARQPGCPDEEVINGVTVHRAGGFLGDFSERARSARSGAASVAAGRRSSPEVRVSMRVARAITAGGIGDSLWSGARLAWRNVYWPDYAWTWYGPATRRAARILSFGSVNRIISVSLPFTAHMVALGLRRRGLFPPGSRWLADIGDPFCFLEKTPTNNYRLYRSLNFHSERSLLRGADAAAVTAVGTRDAYASHFPGIGEKVHVIPPLWTLPSAPVSHQAMSPRRTSRQVVADIQKQRLVFTGTLYSGIRSPSFLLTAFAQLLGTRLGGQLELHFFGDDHQCDADFIPYRELLGRKVFRHGPVDRATVARAITEAAVVINLGNETAYQLPSKIVELACSGKPILNLVRTPIDSSVRFLASHPAVHGVVERTSSGLTSEEVGRLVEFIERRPSVPESLLRDWKSTYGIQAIATAYAALLFGAPG